MSQVAGILQQLEDQGHLVPGGAAQLGDALKEMEKQAFSIPQTVKAYGGPVLKQTAITGSALALIGALAAGREAGADAINALRRGSDYRNMMKEWGGSAGLGKMDSKLVRKAYDTIHTLSPTVARKPLIAGPMVRDMMLHSSGDPSGVSLELGQAEKLLKIETGQRPDPISPLATSVAKQVGLDTTMDARSIGQALDIAGRPTGAEHNINVTRGVNPQLGNLAQKFKDGP
jgi:hypothetical protein